MISLLWFTRLLESVRSLSRLTSSCCAGTEKEKLAGTADTGAAGARPKMIGVGAGPGGGTAGAAGVGADEDVTSNLVCCAAGAGDGEDAAEGEDLEESSGPGAVAGAVAEAAAESLFLRWKLAARSLSRWVFLGDFFFKVEVSFGRGFRRHLEFSCRSLG